MGAQASETNRVWLASTDSRSSSETPRASEGEPSTLSVAVIISDSAACQPSTAGAGLVGVCRLGSGGRRGYGLMIDIRVTLVQLCRQALGLFLLEELRPGPDSSGDAGFPMDSVAFSFHSSSRNAERAQ